MKMKMRSVLEILRNFWKNTDAADLVEYALLLTMVALAAGATLKSFGATVKNAFGNANTTMAGVGTGAAGAGTTYGNGNGVVTVNNNANDTNASTLNGTDAAAALAAAEAAGVAAGNINTRDVGSFAGAFEVGLAAIDGQASAAELAAFNSSADLAAASNADQAAANGGRNSSSEVAAANAETTAAQSGVFATSAAGFF